jgi:hypothetical protein
MSTNNTSIEKVSQAIEAAINECGISSVAKLPAFMQAVRMAQGIRSLREALSDQFVQVALMPLQGTTLGFLTDKDKDGGYGLAVVRDCCIEAMLRGFNVVGNEFNIIAGRFYGAKAGLERKVAEFPGLKNLQLQPGVPAINADKGAVVPYSATWTFLGEPMSIHCQQTKDGLDLRIPVKVNAGMGADAVIGKATRKMLHRIYTRLSGSTLGLSDGEVGEEAILTTGEAAPSPVPEGTPEGKRIKLGGNKSKTNGAAAQAKEQTETHPPASNVPSPAAAPADYPAASIPISQPPPVQVTPVDLVELHETLEEATKEFNFRGASKLLATWTEAQRVEALAWATAVVTDGSMAIQSNRPIHTLVGRQPGDD